MFRQRARTHMLLAALMLSCSTPTEAPAAPDAAEPRSPATPAAASSTTDNDAKAQVTKATLGAPAPDFTLKDVEGREHTLSAHRGKIVVLEWYNPDCPFVKQAHEADGALRTLGNAQQDAGVVWLAINSGAPGKQGNGKERNRASADEYGIRYPVLIDESGDVGRAYGAATTPHMYVINEDGLLVYQGAIDNAPLGDSGGRTRQNFVARALEELAAGDDISTPSTKPWGCSVKY